MTARKRQKPVVTLPMYNPRRGALSEKVAAAMTKYMDKAELTAEDFKAIAAVLEQVRRLKKDHY